MIPPAASRRPLQSGQGRELPRVYGTFQRFLVGWRWRSRLFLIRNRFRLVFVLVCIRSSFRLVALGFSISIESPASELRVG